MPFGIGFPPNRQKKVASEESTDAGKFASAMGTAWALIESKPPALCTTSPKVYSPGDASIILKYRMRH